MHQRRIIFACCIWICRNMGSKNRLPVFFRSRGWSRTDDRVAGFQSREANLPTTTRFSMVDCIQAPTTCQDNLKWKKDNKYAWLTIQRMAHYHRRITKLVDILCSTTRDFKCRRISCALSVYRTVHSAIVPGWGGVGLRQSVLNAVTYKENNVYTTKWWRNYLVAWCRPVGQQFLLIQMQSSIHKLQL